MKRFVSRLLSACISLPTHTTSQHRPNEANSQLKQSSGAVKKDKSVSRWTAKNQRLLFIQRLQLSEAVSSRCSACTQWCSASITSCIPILNQKQSPARRCACRRNMIPSLVVCPVPPFQTRISGTQLKVFSCYCISTFTLHMLPRKRPCGHEVAHVCI